MIRKIIYSFCFSLIIMSLIILSTSCIIVELKEKSENESIRSIEVDNSDSNNKNEYVGVLEIPTINLRKGLVNIDNKNNNVDINVQVILNDISQIDSKSIILAGHSGSGYKAFFRNLDKIKNGDYAYIYYNKRKYIYKTDNIYTLDRNGYIKIPSDDNLLVLTTCYEKDKQLVIILKKIENDKSLSF